MSYTLFILGNSIDNCCKVLNYSIVYQDIYNSLRNMQ